MNLSVDILGRNGPQATDRAGHDKLGVLNS